MQLPTSRAATPPAAAWIGLVQAGESGTECARLTKLLLCLSFVGTTLGTAAADPSTSRIEAVVELHRERFGSQPSLEDQLGRWVRRHACFSPTADAGTLSPHMRAVYDGLHYLLSDELRTQFLGVSSDSLRGEWLRRYWILRDPTPTTPTNEFRDEHHRRVQTARLRFQQDEPPGWDDRGVFMILFGAPQMMSDHGADVRVATGYVPARKYWYYDAGVVVPFELRNPAGSRWVFGISAQGSSSRLDLLREARHGLRDVRLGYGLRPTMYDESRVQPDEVDPLRGAAIALSYATARELLEERRERIASVAPQRPPLWFVMDVDAFVAAGANAPAPGTRTRFEVHIQVDPTDLAFEDREGRALARLGVEGVLLDADLHEAARDAYEDSVVTAGHTARRGKSLVPGQLNFDLEPGEYRLALRVVDLTSTAEGKFASDVLVPKLAGPQLLLSDIELATEILAPQAGAGRFEKNGRVVLPNPLGAYGIGDELTAYFEIYGLQLDSGGGGRYRISYEIVPTHEGPRAAPAVAVATVTSSFTAMTRTQNPIQELRIDTSLLQASTYDLVLSVHDLVSAREATTSTRFSIVDS